MTINPVPSRFNTVSVFLILPNCEEALTFYEQALGATVVYRMPGLNNEGTMHAEMMIGNSTIMMADENPERGFHSPKSLGGSAASLHLFVEDADALFERAIDAGCKVIRPMQLAFWGDRLGKLEDPYGHQWRIATHVEDVSPEEMSRRAEEALETMSKEPPTDGLEDE